MALTVLIILLFVCTFALVIFIVVHEPRMRKMRNFANALPKYTYLIVSNAPEFATPPIGYYIASVSEINYNYIEFIGCMFDISNPITSIRRTAKYSTIQLPATWILSNEVKKLCFDEASLINYLNQIKNEYNINNEYRTK